MTPRYFSTEMDFRRWLEQNHATANELVVGFRKVGSGKASITYPEARDQALCFGWIDGVRNSIDEDSYMIRFTPRRPKSIWSAVNIARVEDLTNKGLMAEAGHKAFAVREEKRSGIYSFENKPKKFEPPDEKKFRANQPAWKFFEAQIPSYRRTVMFWVMSAKKEETRQKRLAALIASSAKGQWAKPYLTAQKKPAL